MPILHGFARGGNAADDEFDELCRRPMWADIFEGTIVPNAVARSLFLVAV